MSDNKKEVELLLTSYDGVNDSNRYDYIEALETVLYKIGHAAAQDLKGDPVDEPQYLVEDPVYDTLVEYLQALHPESPILRQVWTEDDPDVALDAELDTHLLGYPMLSIQTVKNIYSKEVEKFRQLMPAGKVDMLASLKLNGHGIRVIWKDGNLVKATSRGRNTAGRDISRQAKICLGEYCDAFEELGVVELRGEAMVPHSNMDAARSFNPLLKSPFSAVSSMIRNSASEEETKLLHFVFYDVLTDNLHFDTLEEKMVYLKEIGFRVSPYFTFQTERGALTEDLEGYVFEMDVFTSNSDYYSDGVVCAINDNTLFNDFGTEEKFRLGNLALKIGRWKQVGYSGIIAGYAWEEGKVKKTPVAILQEKVLTATGNSVSRVPLYSPLYILLLEAYPGRTLHFQYGGEAGVVPLTEDGRLITDPSFKEGTDVNFGFESLLSTEDTINSVVVEEQV